MPHSYDLLCRLKTGYLEEEQTYFTWLLFRNIWEEGRMMRFLRLM